VQTWIALLRGVNVGGNKILPMQDLRTLLGDIGFENAETYIQSGNCVFETAQTDPEALATAISGAIGERFGFSPTVLVLSAREMRDAVRDNPFPEAHEHPQSVHVFFLGAPAPHVELGPLEALARPNESFRLVGRRVYLHAPDGIGKSTLATRIEKAMGVDVTARNFRTVLKLAEMAG
jgi:uncharacterized protein (DUF1697 family)